MLQQDNVVAAGAPGLAELGITGAPLATVAPEYLIRFRKAGRFGRRAETLAA
jgi:NADH dehydrogenase